ncbi:hypothetical protein EBH_0060520 [Eimeria brunetti]|uniref:Uncharacterized protein n=1 Tax=Eimeria brunetti TaxID=51314 RepID=U6LZD8_9EIME|nr:hypothetical protein EBH_0060520 [Eimeria brunetti]
MTPTQQIYSIYDQELLALVSALDKWAHLLRPTKVTAHTDHQALPHVQQLKASKPLRGRTARWLDFLAEFPDLTITYLPGARNQVADALSRLPCPSAPCPSPSPIDLPETPSGSLSVLGLATDPSEPPHKTRGTRTDYRKLAGLRRRSSRKRAPSTPVPPPTPTPNPAPEPSTPADPPPTPSSPVLDWPAAYSKCPVFSEPYNAATTTLDFVTDLPLTTTGHDAILVVVDSLSKMAHFIPAKKSHTAADTVELLADRLIRYHGFPDVLVSDRDPRFQSEMLRTYIQADERAWEGLLPALELAYNTTSHSSTELSPFEIMIGENPLTAADLDIVGSLARILPKACSFTVANGEVLNIDRVVPRLSMLCGGECFTGDFLVGPIPYEIILGIDWLVNHQVAWYFQSDKLRTYVKGRWCDLPVLRKELKPSTNAPATTEPAKTPADRSYDALAQQVARITAGEAAAFLRLPPKRYKSRHRAGDRVKIKDVLREARKDTEALERALEGLHFVPVLPEAEPDRVVHVPLGRQGSLLCAIVEHYQATTREQDAKSAAVAAPAADDTEDSPWPTAKLTYTEFDNWSRGHEALRLPPQILTVLQQHRLLFPDSLPDGLPPKRTYDHRILLVPGKLPTKAPIYKMPPDHLSYHTKEIARLTAKGWIGPTYSPICAPTIMVDKHDDGSGERKMRMVVNYQALNTLTIAPEFPMRTVHAILDMLGGAKYFSTLDLEAGFHQIRMGKEDRWKTAFPSVQGLFEYKVMPFGLKGAPATFQASINAYLQPLLGHGVTAYLDDVLNCSPSLDTHASLLQQVLSIFLTHHFYPRLSKCKFAQQELTYLGYTSGAAGIRPSADKVEAILLWPDVLSNETQAPNTGSSLNGRV